MKKVILYIIVSLLICTDAFAYQIKAQDNRTYEYKNGKSLGKGISQSCIFEVDEKNRTIKEISVVATYKGHTTDVAEGHDTGYYQIIANEDGHIVGAKLLGRGIDFIEFNRDGSYIAFSSQHIPQVPGVSLDIAGDYVAVAFGTYSRIEE